MNSMHICKDIEPRSFLKDFIENNDNAEERNRQKINVAKSRSHQSWLGELNAPLNTRAKQKGSSASYPTEDPPNVNGEAKCKWGSQM
jgi:hypothetical protein